MAQFDGGKYSKKGVLSYNYLGGEGGAGKGPVSIIKKGDDWFFADKSGKVRKNLPDGGKLNSTHINNLERDGIFKSAKIDPQGNKLSAAEIKAGPDTESFGDSKSITGSGDGIGVDAEGGLAPELAQRGNLRLSGRDAYDPTNAAPSLSSPDGGGSIDYKKTLERRGMSPAPTSAPVSTSPYEGGSIGPEGVNYEISPNASNVPVSTVANPGGYGDYTYPGGEGTGAVTTSNFGGGREMGIGNNTFSSGTPAYPKQSSYGGNEWQDKNPRGYGAFNPDGPGYRYTKDGAVVPLQPEQSYAPTVQGPPNSVVNNSGRGLDERRIEPTIMGGETYTKDAQGNFNQVRPHEDFDASPEGGTSAVPGIGGKDDSSWGAADWNAVGSVMKGVGGLASAYTGVKNYQLARDAHNAQKAQWQANYNQRLVAYEDNKKLANQEIQERNRILKSRNPNRTDLYKEL